MPVAGYNNQVTGESDRLLEISRILSEQQAAFTRLEEKLEAVEKPKDTWATARTTKQEPLSEVDNVRSSRVTEWVDRVVPDLFGLVGEISETA